MEKDNIIFRGSNKLFIENDETITFTKQLRKIKNSHYNYENYNVFLIQHSNGIRNYAIFTESGHPIFIFETMSEFSRNIS